MNQNHLTEQANYRKNISVAYLSLGRCVGALEGDPDVGRLGRWCTRKRPSCSPLAAGGLVLLEGALVRLGPV